LSHNCLGNSTSSCTSVRQITSHDQPDLKVSPSAGMILPDPKNFANVKFNDFYSFELKIEKKLLSEYHYISIACSTGTVNETSKLSPIFPIHNSIYTTTLDLANPNISYICDTSLAEGSSLSDKYMEVWFTELSLNLFLFIVVVLCRDLQPLKSRGLVPYLAILAQYGSVITSFQYHLENLEFRSKYSCILTAYLYYNLLSVTFFLMPLNYLRYVLLVNINQNKEYLSSNSKGIFFKMIGVLTKITTPGFTLLIIISFLIGIGIVDLMIIGINNVSFVCREYISNTLPIFHFSINIIFIILLFGIGVLDIVLTIVSFFRKIIKNRNKSCSFIKILGRSIYDFYFYSDPFFFRLEQLFSGFIFVIYITTEILSLDRIYSNGRDSEYVYYVKEVVAITRTLVRYMFITYQVLIPLFLSIFNFTIYLIKNLSRKGEVTLNELQIVLFNETLYGMFFEFSKKEWSQENLLCYRDILEYCKTSKLEKRKEMAFDIFQKYLNGTDSPLEINIDQRQCNALLKEMQSSDEAFTEDLFAKVEQSVKVNLSDTLSRFIISKEYLNYEKNSEFVEKELHQKTNLLK
jgi:hypothetical protein